MLMEAKVAGIDQKKCLCGCKNKFGLNCQVISVCRGHFLDIFIKYGSSSSHCLAFEASDLHDQLENGLMKKDSNKPRFILFGDNAYLISSYIATPFPNVSGAHPKLRSKDNYNYYHSQLCI